MKSALLLTLLTTIYSFNIFPQFKDTIKSDSHEHHKNEIGISSSPAYFLKEKVFTYAMHIHYIYNIPKTKLGIGLSFERIFLAPKHSTFGLVVSYRPVEKLSFSVSPGLTFEDTNPTSLFALHIETAYEFEFGRYHVGPAFEFASDPNDYHLSLGLHLGYGF
jgi:hypothetical protein